MFVGQGNRHFDSLKYYTDKGPLDSTLVIKLNTIGGNYLSKGENDSAISYFQAAQKISEQLGFKMGQSVALIRIGICYVNKSEYDKATEYYFKALQVRRDMNDRAGVADVISNMGIVYSDQGDYNKAMKNYFEALKIREEINDPVGKANSMVNIANIYFIQNKYEQALKYYNEILILNPSSHTKYFLAIVYFNVGLCYEHLNDYSRALEFYNKSLNTSIELGDKGAIAMGIAGKGSVYYLTGKYEESLTLLSQSLDILKELGGKKEMTEIYCNLGYVYDSLNQNEKALESFNKGLIISKEINSKGDLQNAYSGISNVYKKMNDFKKAYEYYALFKMMQDSIQKESNLKSLAEIEAKYKVEKKEREIELLKKEQDVKDAKHDKQTQLIFVSIAAIVSISIFLFVLYNRVQLNKKNILQKRNVELERDALAAQMNPHFIFNSLGSIGGFIAENDKTQALEYLAVFSRLIRHNLEHSREQLVSVFDEIKMLESYLYLQQLRYENKFEYKIIADESIDTSLGIAPMFIQPFVENSILHGIYPKDDLGKIEIHFTLNVEKGLICEVIDNGIGREESMKRKDAYESLHKSLSMTITKERLEVINSLKGEKIELTISDIINNNIVVGTKVNFIFPINHI